MGKGTALPADTAPTSDDYLFAIDMAGPTTKKIQLSTLFSILHPIGEIYTNVSGTNPASIFGGTWVAFGAGKVPVGVDSGDNDFSSVEQTGGAKTVALAANNNGPHNHGVNDGGHNHALWSIAQEGGGYTLSAQSNRAILKGGSPDQGDGRTGTSGTNISIQNSGNGDPHNNVQPYITVYMWKRTA